MLRWQRAIWWLAGLQPQYWLWNGDVEFLFLIWTVKRKWTKMALLIYACMYRRVHWLLENPVQSLATASGFFSILYNAYTFICFACRMHMSFTVYNHAALRSSVTQDSVNCCTVERTMRSRRTWECLVHQLGSPLSWFHRPSVWNV